VSRAFGWLEAMMSLALIALTTWAIADTALRRAATPSWLQPAAETWT